MIQQPLFGCVKFLCNCLFPDYRRIDLTYLLVKKITVLIADDHQLIRETWAFIINGDSRFTVVAQCSNGDEAIKMTQERHPEIAILDINMPTSGIEAAAEIRKCSPATGIIALTMYAQPAYLRKLLKLGAKGYITKNSPQKELLEAIITVSKGKRYVCTEMRNIVVDQIFEHDITGFNALSARELELIRHIQQGLSSRKIAIAMNISVQTVGTYRHKILKKLHLHSTIALVNFINESGLES